MRKRMERTEWIRRFCEQTRLDVEKRLREDVDMLYSANRHRKPEAVASEWGLAYDSEIDGG